LAFVYQSEIETANSFRGRILIALKPVPGTTPHILEPIEVEIIIYFSFTNQKFCFSISFFVLNNLQTQISLG
jgi:hypothetical protein